MTFREWLREQEEREDAVGELARDASDDSDFPDGDALKGYEAFLEREAASPEVLAALHLAWSEWSGKDKEFNEDDDLEEDDGEDPLDDDDDEPLDDELGDGDDYGDGED